MSPREFFYVSLELARFTGRYGFKLLRFLFDLTDWRLVLKRS